MLFSFSLPSTRAFGQVEATARFLLASIYDLTEVVWIKISTEVVWIKTSAVVGVVVVVIFCKKANLVSTIFPQDHPRDQAGQ